MLAAEQAGVEVEAAVAPGYLVVEVATVVLIDAESKAD